MDGIALRIAGITKRFPGVTALDGVSVDVRAGEVHGVVGENGAGKSTLMAVISGALPADAGTVEVDGVLMTGGADTARAMGVAIVRQEPALLPDLSVAENMYLKVVPEHRPAASEMLRWASTSLRDWDPDMAIRPESRVDELAAEHRFLVEIAAALVCRPKVLILDEPTEHLAQADVARLFDRIRSLAASGRAIIYISHRIREVREIADVITVLRDGTVQDTQPVGALSESDIVARIIGRSLGATFPPKACPEDWVDGGAPRLELVGLRGRGFRDVHVTVRPGEVVGLAGIDGNGQRETLRALAGLHRSKGKVLLDGEPIHLTGPSAARRRGIAFLSGDRRQEGIFNELSVGENVVFRNLAAVSRLGIVSPRRSRVLVESTVAALAVKTPSTSVPMSSLSGGNQQKALLGGILATSPRVLLIDEPTQGVDVGSKVDIYSDLRALAKDVGTAVVVVSSDALELAGLCDRVLVFSRGAVVTELSGPDLSEADITRAALTASTSRDRRGRHVPPFLSWLAGDTAPAILIAALVLVLAMLVAFGNAQYLSTFNVTALLTLAAPLVLVSMAQTTVMMTGGIDLSVGPLMGFLVVLGSFFLTSQDPPGRQVFGWLLIVMVGPAVGATNWVLVDIFKLPSFVATLATFFALQSASLLLRPSPGGVIDMRVMTALGTQLGPVPVVFLVAVGLTVILQLGLRRTWSGLALRATGSQEHAASMAAVPVKRIRLLAFVLGGLLVAGAAVCLLAQVGSGDPSAGTTYTLTSISAAVIGGASVRGGRGSFLGAALGALLVQQILGAIPFLQISTAWGSYLVGILTLLAVATFSKSRQLAEAA